MKIEDINRFFAQQFAEAPAYPILESVTEHQVQARLPHVPRHLRPGGTISGPAMMMFADAVGYMAVLATGHDDVGAVTANLNIHFLSRPHPADLVASGEVLRMGRRQAVVRVDIKSDGHEKVVASATVTYALPSSDG